MGVSNWTIAGVSIFAFFKTGVDVLTSTFSSSELDSDSEDDDSALRFLPPLIKDNLGATTASTSLSDDDDEEEEEEEEETVFTGGVTLPFLTIFAALVTGFATSSSEEDEDDEEDDDDATLALPFVFALTTGAIGLGFSSSEELLSSLDEEAAFS